MKRRYMIKCAVVLILTKIENNKEYVLLQKRYNTGILDDKYDASCCGHLEKNETLRDAVIREAKEEIGVDINQNDLKYSSTMHANFRGTEYLLIAFSVNKYKGVPMIMEPDKCSELNWFDINNLPKDIADPRKIMIEHYKNGNYYSEYGFYEEL